jgi:hypothetical protein
MRRKQTKFNPCCEMMAWALETGTISICAFAQIEMVGATGIEPVTPPV